MRQIAVLASLLAASFLVACASSNDSAKLLAPKVELRQLVGPADTNAPAGPISVQFELQVENESSEEMRLKRLELEQIGSSVYVLRREPILFKETIAPNAVTTVTFWARAVTRGTMRPGASEPLTVRGVAYFDTPHGEVRRLFMRTIQQGYGAGRN